MRADIFEIITREMIINEFDPAALAEETQGLTGSDLRLVMREAVLSALTEGRMELTQEDLLAAIQDFEERDNLKNMDMIDGDADALVAGGDISGGDDGDATADGGHEHDHGDHDHDHAEHDHADD
jgi:ABC-type Zn2+ transport system substrate-binding protein/surface adhesin